MKFKKFYILIICLFLIISLGINKVQAESPNNRIEKAIKVLNEVSDQNDAESMASLLRKAKGVVIFPKVLKGGFIFGARYGDGLLLKHDTNRDIWYGPYFIEMKGLSYGFQAGVQSIGLVLVINNELGLNNFEESTLTLGGDLSIAAGPVGRSTEASTDIELEAAIYSYSMSKGAFAGVSIEGSQIKNDTEANRTYWGTSLTPHEMLNKRATSYKITSLINTIEKLTATAD
ncbi:lipid-binding SYLF domain-containing protein [Selenihalanaerobacter shriftii]|uniref:Lipid-binding SYLF domain-containing protein n=1 Tax=Selenihalanaerobacter shriftii TaxID=142842 RepID=A0A1T4L9H3_9FIRM|nr:lipid-binding SYLF domain-containing protein [Selenihalanaerobacter shriftii]SJZ51284.1 Lipid-binding SYLF domain-containing protein [Selenihalanaerobacter shriftii]